MFKFICSAVILLVSGLAVAEISEKIRRKLDTTETTFKAAIQKADNVRFYAVQKATADRVKVLKQLVTEATRAGDLDGATDIKSKISLAESAGIRPRPKNVVKVGNHEYALIPDKVTWHVAKRRCEEMGGHLVCIETPDEEQFVLKLCGTQSQSVWMGASDEEAEDNWQWVNGVALTSEQTPRWNLTNEGDQQHHLCYWAPGFGDASAGTRLIFLCEWES